MNVSNFKCVVSPPVSTFRYLLAYHLHFETIDYNVG